MSGLTVLQDLYSDYLIVNQGQCSCTNLGKSLNMSHDCFTRMLHSEELNGSWLWKVAKPLANRIASPEGVLAIDDTVEEKRYSSLSPWNCYHWDHCLSRSIKGVNQLTSLYYSNSISVPVGFETITKTEPVIDKKTGKEKLVSKVPKQKLFQGLIEQAVHNRLIFRYVVADKWFSSKENMNFIHGLDKYFVLPLKNNRKVAMSKEEKERGLYQAVGEVKLEEGHVLTVYVEGVEFPLLLQKQVFKDGDGALSGSEPTLYLVSNDLDLAPSVMLAIYSIRWKVECFFKSVKSNLGYANSPAHTYRSQINHMALSMIAFIKLEMVKDRTRANHFAFKAKVKAVALDAAWQFWQDVKKHCQISNMMAA
jgi:hypothetical protein